MIKQTLEEWQADMKRRFDSSDEVAFICPVCGTIATVKDHIDAGGIADVAPQQCIGRTTGKGGPWGRKAAECNDGCNWAAFGLFGNMGKGRIVIMPSGKEVQVFDFAPAEVQSNA